MNEVNRESLSGTCSLRDGGRNQCSVISGPRGLMLCHTCDCYSAPVDSGLDAQLRNQHRSIRELVADLITSHRTEPLPFELMALFPAVQREVQYLGPTERHVIRVALGRDPREGARIKLEITFGVMRDGEHSSEPPGFLLESPWLTRMMEAGIAQAIQKLTEAGFRYVGYGQETDDVRYRFDFTKMENIQGSGIVLGACAALTIFKQSVVTSRN